MHAKIIVIMSIIFCTLYWISTPYEPFEDNNYVSVKGFKIPALYGNSDVYGRFHYKISVIELYIKTYWTLPEIRVNTLISETVNGDYYFYFENELSMNKDGMPAILDGIRGTILTAARTNRIKDYDDSKVCLLGADKKCL